MNSRTREIMELNDKYKMGHVASALSYSPVVDYVFDETKGDIYLGKPHGALALYRNWLKNHWITEDDLDDLDGVYTQAFQDRLQIPRVTYVANTLGNAIGVCSGEALASPNKKFIVTVSDSSFLMGTTLESLIFLKRFKQRLSNLEIVVDWNNYTSNNKMPISLDEFQSIIQNLKIESLFTIFSNPKGYGVAEIEKDPIKWHY